MDSAARPDGVPEDVWADALSQIDEYVAEWKDSVREHIQKLDSQQFYSEDQLRDENGRWTAGEGSFFHGTKADFPAFSLDHAGASDPGVVGKAIYLTPSAAQARAFAESPHYGHGKGEPRVLETKLYLKNPAIVQDGMLPDGRSLAEAHGGALSPKGASKLRAELTKAGHDGVVFKLGNDVTQVAVFDPSKVRIVGRHAAEKFYSADQPRDARGQWTDEGGGLSAATPAEFVAARAASSRPGFLGHATAAELKDHTLLLGHDGKVGVAISPEGDIQNLFNNGGPKGAALDALAQAVEAGGTHLDCFDGFLPTLYAQLGFHEQGRMKFDEAQAPSDWDHRLGKPDIVFMSWQGWPQGGKDATLAYAKGPAHENPVPVQRFFIDQHGVRHEGSSRFYADYARAKADSRGAANPRYGREGGPAWHRMGAAERGADPRAGTGDRAALDQSFAFNPDQPRDAHGQWTDGGGWQGSNDWGAQRESLPKGDVTWDYPDWATKDDGVHAYRGVTAAEWEQIRQTHQIQSDLRYSLAGEGTNFAKDAATALSYAHTGRDNPGRTGQPVYVVEVKRTPSMEEKPDGYLQSHTAVPVEHVTRVWRFDKGGVKRQLFYSEDQPRDESGRWTLVGDARSLGGTTAKSFYEKDGQRFLFKPDGAKKALAAEAASKIAHIANPKAVEAQVMTIDGHTGLMAPFIKGAPVDAATLSPADVQQLQREHVIDWATSQHDSHPRQFIRDEQGQIHALDKSQAWKHLGEDRLSWDYHPNAVYGEHPPLYNTVFRPGSPHLKSMDPAAISGTLSALEGISREHLGQILGPYAKASGKGEAFIDKAHERLQQARSHFESHYGKLLGRQVKFYSQDQPRDEKGRFAEVAIDKIGLNPLNLRGAQENIAAGRPSQTPGPIHIEESPGKVLLLEDGYHRLVEAHARGDKTIKARITPARIPRKTGYHPETLFLTKKGARTAADLGRAKSFSAEWDESKHPRASDGKWTDGGDVPPADAPSITTGKDAMMAELSSAPGYDAGGADHAMELIDRFARSQGWTPEEQRAIDYNAGRYGGSLYRDANYLLRNGTPKPDREYATVEAQSCIDNFDKLLKALPDIKDQTDFYRALRLPPDSYALHLLTTPGETYTEKAFTSASASKGFVDAWVERKMMGAASGVGSAAKSPRIYVKLSWPNEGGAKNANAWLGGYESEVNYRPGAKFTVQSAKRGGDGVWNVRMRVKP